MSTIMVKCDCPFEIGRAIALPRKQKFKPQLAPHRPVRPPHNRSAAHRGNVVTAVNKMEVEAM